MRTFKYMGYAAIYEFFFDEPEKNGYIAVPCPFVYAGNYLPGEYYVSATKGMYYKYVYTKGVWYKYTKLEDMYFTILPTRNYSQKEWHTLKDAINILGWKSFNKQFQREYIAHEKSMYSLDIRRRCSRELFFKAADK